MHPPELKHYYIVWNEPLQTLASMSMHIKRNICALNKRKISSVKCSSQKLVDKFIYQGSSVSSNETNINTRLAKAWTSTIGYQWYGSQTWLIKLNAVSSKQGSCLYCYMGVLHGRWLNGWRKSLMATTQECCKQYCTNPGGNTPQRRSYTATYHPSWKLSKLDESDMEDTAGEVGMSSLVMYSSGPLYMAKQRQGDQLEPLYSSSV